MKRTIVFLFLPIFLVSCSGWKNVPDRLESLVNDIELNSKSFEDAEWDQAAAEYHRLMDIYYEHKDGYSSDERVRIQRAVGKYCALLFVNGIRIKELSSTVDKLFSSAPAYLEGIYEVMKSQSSQWPEALDFSVLEQSIEALGDDVDSLFNKLSEGVSGLLERIGL